MVGDLVNVKIEEYEREVLRKSHQLVYDRGQEYVEQMKYFFDNIDNPLMMNNLGEASELFKKIVAFKNQKYE